MPSTRRGDVVTRDKVARDAVTGDVGTALALTRRWAVNWLAGQDSSQLVDLLGDDYELRIGSLTLHGRQSYADAVLGQFAQFPGLGLTVHDVLTDGERVAVRFTEHGASSAHGGRVSAWGGIALHRVVDGRISSTFAEEDYAARTRQLAAGVVDGVEPPHPSPWDVMPEGPDEHVEETVRQWLDGQWLDGQSLDGQLEAAGGPVAVGGGVLIDDQIHGQPVDRIISPDALVVDELFSAGRRAAFHVTQTGRRVLDGTEVRLGIAGMVSVEQGAVVGGRLVRDRLGALRGSRPAPGRMPGSAAASG